MARNIRTPVLFYFIFALFSIYAGYHFSIQTQPAMHLPPQITMDEAKDKSRHFLQEYGFEYTNFGEYAYYSYDKTGANALIDSLGIDGFFRFSDTTGVPLSYWQVLYYKNVPRDKEEELFQVYVSAGGRILGYRYFLPDSVSDSQNSDSALVFAQNYLKQWPDVDASRYTLVRSNQTEHPNRLDMDFVFEKRLKGTEGADRINITVSGGRITRFYHYFQEPTQSNIASVGGANLLFNTISIIVYLSLSLLTLILFLRRYHEGTIAVRHGLWVAVIVYVALVVTVINSWDPWGTGNNIGIISRYYTKWILLGIQMTVSYVYIFINIFTAWSASELDIGDKRARWMSGIDSLFAGKFFTRNVGRELPLGLAFGAILYGIIHLVIYLLNQWGLAHPLMPRGTDIYNSYWPLLTLLTTAVYAIFFHDVVFRKFLISYLYRLKASPFMAVGLSALVSALSAIFFSNMFDIWPSYYTLLPYLAIGLVQGWIFWHYGLLAAMASNFSMQILMESSSLWVTGNNSYLYTVYGALFLLTALTGAGLYALYFGRVFRPEQRSEPEHIRRIKERTRMQKELEIARRVQLGLLPREEPRLPGFELSGICKPALEVGGDYFDFIRLQDGKLGIAIADVSGKGVPAAIYMTLTKGILQSHAEATLSPKSVLTKVNSLMYRTIERSWFVSMFYAVLDPENRRLRYARAGHNPAILLSDGSHDPQLLQSHGIGLGLEQGPIFEKTLAEGEIQLRTGQTLIFYTDGFTEAMNENNEEYGEERFIRFLHENSGLSAAATIRHALAEIERFAGNAPQHDDMTMVVLRVNG